MNKRAINPSLGQRLHQIREHRKISQAGVADAVGVSVGTIQNYEHGRARITTDRLKQLAHALQCEPAELLMPPGSPLPRYIYRRPRVSRPRVGQQFIFDLDEE